MSSTTQTKRTLSEELRQELRDADLDAPKQPRLDLESLKQPDMDQPKLDLPNDNGFF